MPQIKAEAAHRPAQPDSSGWNPFEYDGNQEERTENLLKLL